MVTLLILDGWGHREEEKGNAIKLQGTPNIDKLNKYPHVLIEASGRAVGLTDGQMGNSEVGHMGIGAGIVVKQDLLLIQEAIEDGSFFKNEAFLGAMNHSKQNNSALHLVGLVSDGGVHSHITHLKKLVEMAHLNNIEKVYIHFISDGRDTLVDSGVGFVADLEKDIKGKAVISDIVGRVYAMDREKRYDRLKKAYDLFVNGVAQNTANSATEALKQSYASGVFDEFIDPVIIDKNGKINDGDSVIYFNFRKDRGRELTDALTQKTFNAFETKKFENLYFCSMTEYNRDFTGINIAFKETPVTNNLSNILAENGLKQFRVAETTKYAHITFYFNSGVEKPYLNEERKLIDTINVKDFSEYPQMRAIEITEDAIKAIESKQYDFVLINLSNPDMIGHTGNMEAAMSAVKVIDECAYKIAMATVNAGGDCIVTADHGNIEYMEDEEGNAITSHTTNPVWLWLVSEKYKNEKLIENGKLANIAATILKMLNIEKPDYMEKPMF